MAETVQHPADFATNNTELFITIKTMAETVQHPADFATNNTELFITIKTRYLMTQT